MKLNLAKHKYLSESNAKKIISILTGMMSSVDEAAAQCLTDYDDTGRVYQRGNITIYDGYVWEAKTVAQGAFDESKWTKLSDEFTELDVDTIKGFLSLTPEQLETMANLISTEIRLDKVFSSSDTYTRIDNALKEAKQYCITQLAKKSTGSFKIATSESEVVDGNYLYLIMNSSISKYEIFALVEGSVQKLTTVEVNLSNYLTKTEIETDYLKKTDADGKYATITTVDGKVDKTSIATAISNTPSNEKVASEKAVKTELDGVVKKTDISTTIDKTSTDDTVPSTKAVNDKFDTLSNRIQPNSVMFQKENTSYSTLRELIQNHEFFKSSTAEEFIFGAEGFDDLPVTNWGFSIRLYTGAGNKYIIAYKMLSNDLFYTRSMNYDGTWVSDWKRLCATSVADVPRTIITNNLASTKVSLSNSDSYATYYVNNGTCYVTIWSMTILAACSVETIFNDFPKSAIGVTCPLCNGEESFAQVFISPNSKVIAFNASAATINKSGYCSFSYPVAEE